jgi:hypothetical protein
VIIQWNHKKCSHTTGGHLTHVNGHIRQIVISNKLVVTQGRWLFNTCIWSHKTGGHLIQANGHIRQIKFKKDALQNNLIQAVIVQNRLLS